MSTIHQPHTPTTRVAEAIGRHRRPSTRARLYHALVVLTALAVCGSTGGAATRPVSAGDRAPVFSAREYSSGKMQLVRPGADGSPMVLCFWATWWKGDLLCCPKPKKGAAKGPRCILQYLTTKMPPHDDGRSKALRWVAVAVCGQSDPVAKRAAKARPGPTVLLDPAAKVWDAYGARKLNAVYFIDGSGVVQAKREWFACTKEEHQRWFDDQLRALLKAADGARTPEPGAGQ